MNIKQEYQSDNNIALWILFITNLLLILFIVYKFQADNTSQTIKSNLLELNYSKVSDETFIKNSNGNADVAIRQPLQKLNLIEQMDFNVNKHLEDNPLNCQEIYQKSVHNMLTHDGKRGARGDSNSNADVATELSKCVNEHHILTYNDEVVFYVDKTSDEYNQLLETELEKIRMSIQASFANNKANANGKAKDNGFISYYVLGAIYPEHSLIIMPLYDYNNDNKENSEAETETKSNPIKIYSVKLVAVDLPRFITDLQYRIENDKSNYSYALNSKPSQRSSSPNSKNYTNKVFSIEYYDKVNLATIEIKSE